jgi:hypothetical protein
MFIDCPTEFVHLEDKISLIQWVRTYDGVNHIREFDAQELKDYLLLAGFTEPNVKTFNYYSSLKDKIVYKIFNFVSLRRLLIATSRK